MNTLRQEWATPTDFWHAINGEFVFDIDVCATALNAKCHTYITPQQDAFKTPWFTALHVTAFCNPGFAKPLPWLQRAHEQVSNAKHGIAVVMGLCAPSTRWWQYAVKHCTEIRLLSPRVQYVPPPGITQSSNARECAMFVFCRNRDNDEARIWTWQWKETT